MSLFKRRKDSDQPSEPSEPDAAVGEPSGAVTGEGADDAVDQTARAGGPYDVADVDGVGERVDVGALWVPLREGMELQLQMDETSEQVTGVFVVLGESAVQLQAFAAPRHEGIWSEICDEIAAGITEQGGTADPGYGRWGKELLARVPGQQPDGKVGFQPLRFTGVNGRRWLLRAVFHGGAAIEPAAAAELEDLVSEVVVVRGPEPMGPRELLPLHLPVGAEPTQEAPAAEPGADDDGAAGSFDDLQPFERGPEITERR